jgi:NADH-quinone oxidoreductase subunit A
MLLVEEGMGQNLTPYVAIAVTIVLCLGLGLAIIALNYVLGPKRSNPVKGKGFECGNPQADSPRKRFSVRFYLVAIAFLVFDIEAVFLYPWAVVYRDLLKDPVYGQVILLECIFFIGILALGLWAIWRKKALDWAFDRGEDE